MPASPLAARCPAAPFASGFVAGEARLRLFAATAAQPDPGEVAAGVASLAAAALPIGVLLLVLLTATLG